MDKALEILHTSPQDLRISERATALAQCKTLALQLEASQRLDNVRDVGSSGFQFKPRDPQRLKTLLNTTSTNKRINQLQESNPGLCIMLGLCLTTRDIIRMEDIMFDEILRQAQMAEPQLTPHLVCHPTIIKIVNASCNHIFKERFEALRVERTRNEHRASILVNGGLYFHYIAPTQPKLEPLISLSFNGTVAVYVPELDVDGILRITTPWNIELLEKLFVFTKGEATFEDASGFTTCSFIDRVEHCLGQDILNAIESSITRAMENRDELTSCVKCQGFPGQVIIIDVTISKAECISILC